MTGGHVTARPLRESEFIVIKRILAAAFVTAVTAVGVAAPADAAPKHEGVKAPIVQQAIDWD